MATQAQIQQFTNLVNRLEKMARGNPAAYRTRMLALALLAFVYVVIVFVLSAGLMGAIIWGAVWLFRHLGDLHSVRAVGGAIKLILVVGIPVAIFTLVHDRRELAV